ncbi:hypothetical protein GCM10009745_72240 [Kribbella yunnanensis]|uniref:CHAD domain-containing protein n=1 Tax=Kribbella yunnanensis TaxID=190194 RepID=A0ABN2IX13_9ACTN
MSARVLDDPAALVVGRAEVATIALIGADVVMAATRSKTAERRRLLRVTAELEKLSGQNPQRKALGQLGGLSVSGPGAVNDDLSRLARYAARWERADDSVTLQTLLTRDLRSTTAQIRTVCAYVWYLVDQVRVATPAGLEPWQRLSLRLLNKEVRAAEAGALRVAESWRRRLSDVHGHTGTPSEAMFIDLKEALDRLVRPGDSLLEADTLVPDRDRALRLLGAIDEMVWSAEQVGRRQQRAVAALVGQGRLFVPRQELSRYDLRYLRRPANASLLQSRWLRSTNAAFFSELTSSLAWSVDHLAAASLSARRLVGTSQQTRPHGGTSTRSPAPYLELSDPVNAGQEPDSGRGRLL